MWVGLAEGVLGGKERGVEGGTERGERNGGLGMMGRAFGGKGGVLRPGDDARQFMWSLRENF